VGRHRPRRAVADRGGVQLDPGAQQLGRALGGVLARVAERGRRAEDPMIAASIHAASPRRRGGNTSSSSSGLRQRHSTAGG
jgi:hypothetical protein